MGRQFSFGSKPVGMVAKYVSVFSKKERKQKKNETKNPYQNQEMLHITADLPTHRRKHHKTDEKKTYSINLKSK